MNGIIEGSKTVTSYTTFIILSFLSYLIITYHRKYRMNFFGSKIFKGSEYSQQAIKENQQKMKVVKYPAKAISIGMMIKKKLNQLNPDIRGKLEKKMDRNINAYRQVRGDGNCFFRALAFSYISNKKRVSFEEIFTNIDDISLESCKKETIPKQFQPFYKDALLKEILKTFWEKQFGFFVKTTRESLGFSNYKRALARMLTQYPYLDFIIILYFRAICLIAFKKKKQEFKEFLKGTEEDEISTYGEESQGVILNLMSKFFKINVIIYEIRKNEVVCYEYNDKVSTYFSAFSTNNIYLLFYDNHYDILEQNNNPLLQYEDEKQDEQYYQKTSSEFVKGTCILCQKNGEVNTENGLCQTCISQSMQNLDTFKKDQFIPGFCNSCNCNKARVSEQLQICERCLQNLQFQGGQNAERQVVHGYRCKQCKIKKNREEISDEGVCYVCMFPEDVNHEKESAYKASKIKSSSSLSSSQFPNLIGKLQSKTISKEEKESIEEEIDLRKEVQGKEGIQEVKGLFRGKFFDRSTPYKYLCIKCKMAFESTDDLDENEQLCEFHRKGESSNIKTSKLPQEKVKQSAVRPAGVASSEMRPDRSGIRPEPAKQPFQSEVKPSNVYKASIKHQNISTIKEESESSLIKVEAKDPQEYVFRCKKCDKTFKTFVDGLAEQEKVCVNCLKQMRKYNKNVSQSTFKKPDQPCKMCKKADDMNRLSQEGICTNCLKKTSSSVYHKPTTSKFH